MAESKKTQKQPKQTNSKPAHILVQDNKGVVQSIFVAAAAVIAVAVIAYVFIIPALGIVQVPFSTFKTNLQGSQRVSIVASYNNITQSNQLEPCYSSVIHAIAMSRKASTIDFYLINKANATCTYSSTGLGGSVSLTTTNSSYCVNIANSEAGIYLNYTQSNSTTVTANHLFVYGNAAYMAACPIVVELS